MNHILVNSVAYDHIKFKDDDGYDRHLYSNDLPYLWFEGTSASIKGGTMSNIVKKIKDLALSKDDRLLREQGITDDCGQLTEEGRQVLEQVVFQAHKGAVVTLVQNVADAEKAEKKKK